MTKKPATSKDAADNVVKNICRKTRLTYSDEEKIRIVLAGRRGEEGIAVLCRREGIAAKAHFVPLGTSSLIYGSALATKVRSEELH